MRQIIAHGNKEYNIVVPNIPKVFTDLKNIYKSFSNGCHYKELNGIIDDTPVCIIIITPAYNDFKRLSNIENTVILQVCEADLELKDDDFFDQLVVRFTAK